MVKTIVFVILTSEAAVKLLLTLSFTKFFIQIV
uniref:Uncharacterized protein n=1 Tax=Siphoviridae sp. ctAUQ2 TaxID=2826182 RepID=A0A8S5MYW3_9CAUD|nr:MAG TPA: hypothetical protein [Siphoviridae sp. ctAUQ2]